MGDAATAAPTLEKRPFGQLRDLHEFRYLVRYLVASSLQTERVTMLFGFLWWLLDPLFLLVIYSIVMNIILRRGTIDGYSYPIFLLAAILPWEFAVRAARNSIVQTYAKEREMRQVAFPRAVVPLSITLAEFVKLLFALALYPFVALLFGAHLSAVVLLAIPLSVFLLLFTLGLVLTLSAVNFFFRDVDKLTVHGFRLWFFLSPALYSVSMVPARLRVWYQLNPFAPMLEAFRGVLLLHHVPSIEQFGVIAGVSVAAAAVGLVFFQRCEPAFAKVA